MTTIFEKTDINEAKTSIEIVVNDVTIGLLYPDELKAKAQFDLERLKATHELIWWLKQYANVPLASYGQLQTFMEELPLIDLANVGKAIGEAINQVLQIPKTTRKR